jgi:hypothetical protein
MVQLKVILAFIGGRAFIMIIMSTNIVERGKVTQVHEPLVDICASHAGIEVQCRNRSLSWSKSSSVPSVLAAHCLDIVLEKSLGFFSLNGWKHSFSSRFMHRLSASLNLLLWSKSWSMSWKEKWLELFKHESLCPYLKVVDSAIGMADFRLKPGNSSQLQPVAGTKQGRSFIDNGARAKREHHSMGCSREWQTQKRDPEKMKEDKEKVREYVKKELFERVVFLWSKASLEPGKVLHHDYLKNCRARLADGKLADDVEGVAETYMNLLWGTMVKDKCCHEWLSHK